MKKIIYIMIICLLSTGCTVEYNLNVDDKNIKEDITIQVQDSSTLDTEMYNQLTNPKNKVYLNEYEYYKMNYTEGENNIISHFTYKHDLEKYNQATVLDLCYSNRNIEVTEDKIIISTKGSFACAFTEFGENITNAKINITTNLKVIENNADEIYDNTYTWNINESNYTNKPITIVMEKTTGEKLKNVVKQIEVNSASKDLFIIYGGIALLLVLVILLVIIKLKKNNEI